MLDSLGLESALKCVSWRNMMSALHLHMERINRDSFSGMSGPRAFRETILVGDLVCLVDRRAIAGVKVVSIA